MSYSSKKTRIFVGGLTKTIREKDLERFFRKYGHIKEVSKKNGFAFVEFEDYRDAENAVYECNGKDLMGEIISVERAKGTPRGSDKRGGFRGGQGYERTRVGRDSRNRYDDRFSNRSGNRLIVENLSSTVNWQDLKCFMRQAGVVTYANAHRQKRNEGFVEYANLSDMKNALEKLQDHELNGRKIHLVEDTRNGSGRRRSRSRSKFRRSSSSTSTRSKSSTPSKEVSPKPKDSTKAHSTSVSENSD